MGRKSEKTVASEDDPLVNKAASITKEAFSLRFLYKRGGGKGQD